MCSDTRYSSLFWLHIWCFVAIVATITPRIVLDDDTLKLMCSICSLGCGCRRPGRTTFARFLRSQPQLVEAHWWISWATSAPSSPLSVILYSLSRFWGSYFPCGTRETSRGVLSFLRAQFSDIEGSLLFWEPPNSDRTLLPDQKKDGLFIYTNYFIQFFHTQGTPAI